MDLEQGNSKEAQCLVCLAPLKNGDQVSTSNNSECDHIFHYECIYQWLQQNTECPLCRSQFLLLSLKDKTDQANASSASLTELDDSASAT